MNPTASPGASGKCPRNRRQNEPSLHQDFKERWLSHVERMKSNRMHIKVGSFPRLLLWMTRDVLWCVMLKGC
jgi:hypothetical protein